MTVTDRISIFLRSLTVQGSWNFPQMQGLGFFYVMAPWLRKVSGKNPQEAYRRHFGYFNTHPFMVSYLAGVVARLEEEGRIEESERVSKHMMGPLGAVGDAFFWAKLRPFAILSAVTVSFFWPWAAVPVLLVIFNAVHLKERWSGIINGYSNADDPASSFSVLNRKIFSRHFPFLVMTMCGFILGAAAFQTEAPGSAMVLFCLGFSLFRLKKRIATVLVTLLIAGFILGILGIRIGLPWSV